MRPFPILPCIRKELPVAGPVDQSMQEKLPLASSVYCLFIGSCMLLVTSDILF